MVGCESVVFDGECAGGAEEEEKNGEEVFHWAFRLCEEKHLLDVVICRVDGYGNFQVDNWPPPPNR